MKQAQTGWTFHALLNALGPLVKDVDGQTGAELGEISTDSRTITSGSVFVALKGPNFDGHDYAVAAKDRGAGVLIVERNVGTGASCPQIIVTDTVEAYGALARAWRAQFSIPLICVVGSNGKTTTTQMIASILRQACGEEAMLATEGNFNNAVGVPRMLLKLTPRTKAAVIEAGISHPGEMAQLISWIRPTVVVITNAQREHQEFLKGVEASARENAMALVSLSAKGTAVLPADDACLPVWLEFARARGCKVATYAAGDTDFAVDLRATEAMGTVTMAFGSETLRLELKMAGRHAVHDAAAAAAAAVSVIALFNMAGRMAAGMLSDRLGRLAVLMGALVLSACGLGVLMTAGTGDDASFYLGCVLVGLSFGAFMAIYPGFGTAHASVNYGIMFCGFAAAGFGGPTLMREMQAAGMDFEACCMMALGFCAAGLMTALVCRIMMKTSEG